MNSADEQSENEKRRKKQKSFARKISGELVKFRCDLAASTQTNVMLARGWVQVTDPIDQSWDLWWCERSEVRKALNAKLDPRQKIPHYENHHELTRKDYLWRNLKRYRKLLKKAGKMEESELADSMPVTFELPSQYRMLVEEYHKQAGSTWIVKPAAGSQGRGIFLFQRLKDLNDWRTKESTGKATNEENDNGVNESFVVQKYVEDPYLIAGVAMASLQAVQSVMMHSTNSFELYGYDIIIDENLRPWLLEINASPALTPTDNIDQRLKYNMLEDVLNVLDLEGVLTGRETRVGGFDLLWDTGPIWTSCYDCSPSSGNCLENLRRELSKLNIFLGANNDREDQLTKLHEELAARRKIGRKIVKEKI